MRTTVVYHNRNWFTQVRGATPEYLPVRHRREWGNHVHVFGSLRILSFPVKHKHHSLQGQARRRSGKFPDSLVGTH